MDGRGVGVGEGHGGNNHPVETKPKIVGGKQNKQQPQNQHTPILNNWIFSKSLKHFLLYKTDSNQHPACNQTMVSCKLKKQNDVHKHHYHGA
jgi:hypothetical protein